MKKEKEDLDEDINEMIEVGWDKLRIKRMKKKKIEIKEKIKEMEDKVINEIIEWKLKKNIGKRRG